MKYLKFRAVKILNMYEIQFSRNRLKYISLEKDYIKKARLSKTSFYTLWGCKRALNKLKKAYQKDNPDLVIYYKPKEINYEEF